MRCLIRLSLGLACLLGTGIGAAHEFNGEITLRAFGRVASDDPMLTYAGTRLKLRYEHHQYDLDIYAEGRLRWNGVFMGNTPYSKEARDAYEVFYDWREIYVQGAALGFDWSLGWQQVVWGKADQLRILDQVNPLDLREFIWLDTARVVRRAWPEFSQKGYGLANVTRHFGIEFRHHDAKEDARAAGEVLLRAVAATGLSVEHWLERAVRPIHAGDSASIARDANADGPLFGEKPVFTGALSMPRREAADAASMAGCEVEAGVTKHTTVLVVGDQDIHRLSGQEKRSKHRKAEDIMKKGQ